MEDKLKVIKQFFLRLIKNYDNIFENTILGVMCPYSNIYSIYEKSEINTKKVIFSCMCEYIVILLHNKLTNVDEMVFYEKLIDRYKRYDNTLILRKLSFEDKVNLIANVITFINTTGLKSIYDAKPFSIFHTILKIIDYSICWGGGESYHVWEKYNKLIKNHFLYEFLII